MRDACGLTRDFRASPLITTLYSPDILSALVPFLVLSLSGLSIPGGGEVEGESSMERTERPMNRWCFGSLLSGAVELVGHLGG